MASSILTNTGAMTALQSLQATQKSLLDTQNRISTGLKVSNAKDNAATWAVATSMRSDIATFKQVSENLSLSSSVIGVARTGAETVSGLITDLRKQVTAAQQGANDSRKIQTEIDNLVSSIESFVQGAAFKGVNLINGAGTERVLSSINQVSGNSVPSYIDVNKLNLSTQAGGLLNGLRNVSVVSRGDQLFNDSNPDDVTATERAMGTTYMSFDVVDEAAGAGNGNEVTTGVAGTVVVGYKDADGNTRSLSVQVGAGVSTAAGLKDALNADAQFSKFFRAEGGADDFRISALNRVGQSGKFEVTGLTGTKFTAGSGTISAALTGTSMTFQDKVELKMGETFTLKYNLNGTDKSLVLKVTNDTAGTQYQAKDLVNNIEYRTIKYDTANVRDANGDYQGSAIAGAIAAALATADDFSTTAATNDKMIYNVSTATLKITGNTAASNGDKFVAFEPVATDYKTILKTVDKASESVIAAAASFGSAQTRIDSQKDFMDKLVDTLTAGVGALVDADMSAEAARLQALQVQQQLGTQALSIANQAPQTILALFRG